MRPEAPIGTLRPALEGACDSLGLALDPAALDRLLAYLALLQRWNNNLARGVTRARC
jgi:16S rRNA G527 N7-methylase RsmG